MYLWVWMDGWVGGLVLDMGGDVPLPIPVPGGAMRAPASSSRYVWMQVHMCGPTCLNGRNPLLINSTRPRVPPSIRPANDRTHKYIHAYTPPHPPHTPARSFPHPHTHKHNRASTPWTGRCASSSRAPTRRRCWASTRSSTGWRPRPRHGTNIYI